MQRYVSADEDSGRWADLPLRDGDIVVSTRSKHGTTWVQTILLMLIHGPDLPVSLPVLSPWVDHLVEPIEEVVARIESQDHRRVMKTHSPLDGIPQNPAVHYVVVARHPLDAAVSLSHHGSNIDRTRLAELTGSPATSSSDRPDLDMWLSDWVRAERKPVDSLDSLQGVMWHLSDAWQRRHQPNVTLVHFSDLLTDLEGQIRRLTEAVGSELPANVGAVVEATRFEAMRDQANELVPDAGGVLSDHRAFFRRGRSGAGEAHLSAADLAVYHVRVKELVDPELDAWLHR